MFFYFYFFIFHFILFYFMLKSEIIRQVGFSIFRLISLDEARHGRRAGGGEGYVAVDVVKCYGASLEKG
jgi:hypothetical protein